MSKLIETAPKRIYLQIDDVDCSNEPFPFGEEITWCWDSVMDCEVEYVRADLDHRVRVVTDDECKTFLCKLPLGAAHTPVEMVRAALEDFVEGRK